jgi:hypothetical protein
MHKVLSMDIFLTGLTMKFGKYSFDMEDLKAVLETELQCSKCYEFLPDDMFHAGKAFPARRCRQMICRECLKVKSEPSPVVVKFKLPTRLKLKVSE